MEFNKRIMLLHILFYMQVTLTTNAEFLFRASPGGDGYKSAGLWGGLLNLDHSGQGSNLYSHGYDSLNTSSTTYYGIEMEYVSFDPITNRVLMIVDEPDGSVISTKHSMALGPLCKDGCAPLEATFQNFKLSDENHPFLMDQDCGWKCAWGPFAYYNNKIYFVLSAVFGTRYNSLTRQIQIRVLDGCEGIIETIRKNGGSGTISDFPVLSCSILINVLYQEQYEIPNPRPKVWVAKDLKIIQADNTFHFFLQYIDTTASSPKLKLVHSYNDNVHVLHSETISSVFAGNIKVRGLGSIDYKNGYLCWTATEKLYCSVYDLRGIDGMQATVVLDGNEAMQKGVCNTGNLPKEELQRSLTGVAISDTKNTLSIYFGCYADIPATGGIGLIQLSNHGLIKRLHQVKSSSHKVYGGNLFISNSVDMGCEYAINSNTDSTFSSKAGSSGAVLVTSTKGVSSSGGTVICGNLPSTSSANQLLFSISSMVTLLLFILLP